MHSFKFGDANSLDLFLTHKGEDDEINQPDSDSDCKDNSKTCQVVFAELIQ